MRNVVLRQVRWFRGREEETPPHYWKTHRVDPDRDGRTVCGQPIQAGDIPTPGGLTCGVCRRFLAARRELRAVPARGERTEATG